MKRNMLISLLENYFPVNSEEIEAKRDIINFIKKYENCFERSLAIGHITASCWLLSKDKTKALLMHHTKLDMWVQLGGHCDGNPDPLEVAVKEAQEESGIQNIYPINNEIFDIDIHFIPANSKEAGHYHYDVRFLLGVNSDEDIVRNSESKELRWIGKEKNQLPTYSLSVVRMFNKWLENSY